MHENVVEWVIIKKLSNGPCEIENFPKKMFMKFRMYEGFRRVVEKIRKCCVC